MSKTTVLIAIGLLTVPCYSAAQTAWIPGLSSETAWREGSSSVTEILASPRAALHRAGQQETVPVPSGAREVAHPLPLAAENSRLSDETPANRIPIDSTLKMPTDFSLEPHQSETQIPMTLGLLCGVFHEEVGRERLLRATLPLRVEKVYTQTEQTQGRIITIRYHYVRFHVSTPGGSKFHIRCTQLAFEDFYNSRGESVGITHLLPTLGQFRTVFQLTPPDPENIQ